MTEEKKSRIRLNRTAKNPMQEHQEHYEGTGNGLATNEDDLPDRGFEIEASEIADKDEYVDEP